MTTWKHRKKAAKRHKVLTIGLAVFAFFCGIVAGHVWSPKNSTVKQLTHELESAHFDRAKVKYELEKVSKISDIHNDIEAVLLKILDVYRKQSKVVEAADKNVSKNKKDKTKRELEMMWESEFSPLKDRLSQLENTLSELENREPRDFPLPAPPSMTLREIKK
jgi:hypothetical protein